MKNSKKITDAIKAILFDPGAIDQMVDELKQEIQRKNFLDMAFFKGPRFAKIIEQLKEELKKGPISDDSYVEGPLFGDATNDEFIRLFSCLFNRQLSGVQITILAGDFEQEEVEYYDIIFNKTYGQGTLFSARLK